MGGAEMPFSRRAHPVISVIDDMARGFTQEHKLAEMRLH